MPASYPLRTAGWRRLTETEDLNDRFVFRQGRSRETSYARDYDRLFGLLDYEREYGKIVWGMGPACAFDHDARACMQVLVENGYVDADEFVVNKLLDRAPSPTLFK